MKKYQWPVNVLALKLNKTSITLLKRREGFQLKLNSKNASKYAEWRTSNSSIASVSANGYVTPHSSGSAVMNARYGNVTVSCSVSVMDVTIATLRKVNSPKSNKQKRHRYLSASGYDVMKRVVVKKVKKVAKKK